MLAAKIRAKEVAFNLNENNLGDCLQMVCDLSHTFLPSTHCTSVSSVRVHSIAAVA